MIICYLDGMRPEFMKPLTNKSVNLKKPITLECEGVGKPFPTARWYVKIAFCYNFFYTYIYL